MKGRREGGEMKEKGEGEEEGGEMKERGGRVER